MTNAVADCMTSPNEIRPGEQPWRLHGIGQRVDRLAHGQIPGGESHHAVQPVPVVRHHLREPPAQQTMLDGLAPVQADGGAGIPHPHQRVTEAGIAKFVEELNRIRGRPMTKAMTVAAST